MTKIHNHVTELADIWMKNIKKKIKKERQKNRRLKSKSHG